MADHQVALQLGSDCTAGFCYAIIIGLCFILVWQYAFKTILQALEILAAVFEITACKFCPWCALLGCVIIEMISIEHRVGAAFGADVTNRKDRKTDEFIAADLIKGLGKDWIECCGCSK